MALSAGMRFGPYEITSPIAAGGMGEVYRGFDTNLKRSVAIKVLPADASADPERLARFQREAEVLASLNHPNIAAIHGLERNDNVTALVMELVEGPTLADVIAAGPIPCQEALAIARQIAEALEAAHQRNVVHRDLKPANVKIDGRVKVLDFGLAKVLDPEHPVDSSKSPTITFAATRAGVILGTAAYMSPEQATGRAAEAQADIWAFGVVLFEMLAGRPPFTGETTMEVLGGVIKEQPRWAALPDTTPPTVRALLRRCLQKDSSQRFRNIGDVRLLVEEAMDEEPTLSPAVTHRRRIPGAWVLALIGGAALGAVTMAVYEVLTRDAEIRLEITTGAGNPNAFALSPDGTNVIYNGTVRGDSGMWLRSMRSDTPRLIGPAGAYPFWAPDSQSVAYVRGRSLTRVDLTAGVTRTIAEIVGNRGGTWNRDNVILLGQTAGPLLRVAAAGGTPTPATSLLPLQTSHRVPQFLPDGRHFFYYAAGPKDVRGLYIGVLGSTETRRLTDAETSGVFVPPDFVLYARQATLYAHRVDVTSMSLVGVPIVITEKVELGDLAQVGRLAHSASATGRLAYRATNRNTVRQLTWLDRNGRVVGTVGEPDRSEKDTPRVSPDGRYVAVSRSLDGNADVWLVETASGRMSRLTTDTVLEGRPVWSPDGAELLFNSYEKGKTDLYRMTSAGATPTMVLETSGSKDPYDWSMDGFIVYADIASGGLWAHHLRDGRKLLVNQRAQGAARFSPNGKWVAYSATDGDTAQVYLQSFPDGRNRRTVSTRGGRWPEWRADMSELFYLEPDDTVVAVKLTPKGDGLEPGTPLRMFRPRIQPPRPFASGTQYTVDPNGERFLVNALVGEGETVPLTVVLDWRPPR